MKYFRQNYVIHIPMIISILIIFFFMFYYDFKYINPSGYNAVGGKTVYTENEANDKSVIKLIGEWQILYENAPFSHQEFATFPDALLYDNRRLTTYQMDVTVPQNNAYYSIFIPKICAGSALYVDNELIYDNLGSNSPMLYNPTKQVSFYAEKNVVQIKLQVNNSMAYFPIKSSPILFGTVPAINNRIFQLDFADYIFAAICFVVFMYYLVIYIYDKKNKQYGAISILSLAICLKTLINNYSFLYYLFPNLTMKEGLVLNVIVFPITIILYFYYTNLYLSEYYSKVLYIIGIISSAFMIASSFFLKVSQFYILDILFGLVLTYANILITIASIRAVNQKKRGSVSFLVSVLLVLLVSAIDVFDYYTHYLSRRYFTSGFVLFIVCQTFIYLKQNAFIYDQEKTLANSLSDTLTKMKREENNFLSSHLRAHFLFNALNIISGYSLFDSKKATKISAALTIYLKQLFEHDNLNELTTLKNEIELLHAFGYIEEERFPNLTIVYDIPSKLPDLQVPSLILQPLLENAVNHGIRKKSSQSAGTIIISIKPSNDYVDFSIKDDGAGIDERLLYDAINTPKKNVYNNMYQIQSRLKKLYNENIIAKSIPGIGTIISFRIPRAPISE